MNFLKELDFFDLILQCSQWLLCIDLSGGELRMPEHSWLTIALRGMRTLLERDHPVVVVETSSDATVAFLESLGYATRRLPGSSNLVCEPRTSGTMQDSRAS